MSTTIDGTNSSTFPADASINGLTVGRGGGAVSTNTAVGASALASNSTGAYLTSVGTQALTVNTNSFSSAFGYQAGYSNTSGTQNTYLGRVTGYSNITGNNNVYVGDYTGYAATGSNNCFVGFQAGYQVTSGAKNTIIGGYNGNQGGLDIRTASNYVVLSDGDGNPRGYFADTGQFTVSNSGTGNSMIRPYATSASFASIICDVWADRNTTNSTFNAFRYYNVGAGEIRFRVLDSGNVQNVNNSYGGTSDIKLKENIVDATPKLEDLCKVKIRQYNFKSNPSHKQIGVIAQELEEVFAGMVEESPDRDKDNNDLGTTTKAVKYSVFVPMLVKAVQELKSIVDTQAAEIAELKAKVA
jgi:hypothetical protein